MLQDVEAKRYEDIVDLFFAIRSPKLFGRGNSDHMVLQDAMHLACSVHGMDLLHIFRKEESTIWEPLQEAVNLCKSTSNHIFCDHLYDRKQQDTFMVDHVKVLVLLRCMILQQCSYYHLHYNVGQYGAVILSFYENF